MAKLQFPQPKLAEESGGGAWRLTGRVSLPEDGSLDRAAELLGWQRIPCTGAGGAVRSVREIHAAVWDCLSRYGLGGMQNG